ncbi:serine/threonine-protein kinase RsbW [Celeribacter persicus]|uniref:Serine/threonine-protein kinase RsbW n=1 Tax=Celeribacter persicus TaxID=1651082 RepID=A0A2T5HF50_9RHOB|nr:serine/threonine-protein kinase RsbW [Celeribacter persicus]
MRPEGNLSRQETWEVPPQPKEHTLRIILPATEAAVRRGLESIKSGLGSVGYGQDELASLEIVLAEALNNIVEHAYADHSDGMIEIHLSQTAKGLWCTILDNGQMMPGGEPPIGRSANLDCEVADLPEGGFGWFLIRELAHELEYVREGDRNRLCFRMSIGHMA